MMYPSNMWQRATLAIGLIVATIALVLVAYPTGSSLAQTGGTAILVGEVVEGQLGTDGTATYTFTAEAGDVVQVSVLAFDFVPSIEVQSAGNPMAMGNQAPMTGHVVQMTYVVTSTSEQTIVVRGQGATTGRFALSLALVESNLAEGTVLISGQGEQVELSAQPSVYRFSGDENSTLVLTIRSRTADFHPHILLMTDSGEVVAELNSPYLAGAILTIEPGTQNYILLINKGVFVDVASVEVSLAGGDLGLAEVPDGACYATASTRINIRSGGSTDYPIIGVLGAERYLAIVGSNPANDIWYQVQIPDGRLGWVAADVVALIGGCDNLPEVEYPPLPTAEDQPTAEATSEATVEPTAEATAEPTMEPTVEPTLEPTLDLTLVPTIAS